MNTDIIVRLLSNSGLHVYGVDSDYIYLEDPTCIIRSFETFLDYAWAVIAIVTALMLFGWALSMIRGAKNDIFTNLRNIILIFGALTIIWPIINVIYGDNLYARGCRTVQVPLADVEKILDARNDKLAKYTDNYLYESLDIYDSGVLATDSAPAIDAPEPITVPDVPAPMPVAPSTPKPMPEPMPEPAPAPKPATPAKPTAPATPMAQSPNARATSAAVAAKKRVLYQYADNSTKTHIDGSPAWRNTNPGNIIVSKFATRHGAIGDGGKFAIFPDETTGMAAIKALLQTESYRDMTIANAIAKYAPQGDNNDVAAYHNNLRKITGLSINKRVRDLSDDEMDKLARGIRQIEGWITGDVKYSNQGR